MPLRRDPNRKPATPEQQAAADEAYGKQFRQNVSADVAATALALVRMEQQGTYIALITREGSGRHADRRDGATTNDYWAVGLVRDNLRGRWIVVEDTCPIRSHPADCARTSVGEYRDRSEAESNYAAAAARHH